MDWKLVKQYYIFGLALVLAAFLVWFGSKFIFTSGGIWSSNQLFAAGIILVFSGIFVVSSQGLGNNWLVGGFLILCGFFMLARSVGIIEYAWLSKIIGISSWIAAALMAYITFPRARNP